jgi:hypothetical protein
LRLFLIVGLGWALFFLVAWWFRNRRVTVLVPTVIVVVLLAALLFLPINDLLSGFSVVRGDASFMVRYGAEISFWGVVIGVIGLGLALIPALRPSLPGGQEPVQQRDPAG